MKLADTIDRERKITVLGLAKNTGKTVAMKTLYVELCDRGDTVGVTSVGRDGETHDALNYAIRKPRIWLSERSLVATTDGLLAKSGVPVQTLKKTELRTPLGKVVIGRVLRDGNIEVAGPSAIDDVAHVSDLMLRLGAKHVLIDGAINRKAAAAPDVSDAVIVSTGAILDADLETVVSTTKEAVALFRLPALDDPEARKIAEAIATDALLDEELRVVPLDAAALLRGAIPVDPERIASARYVVMKHALLEPFLEALVTKLKSKVPPIVVRDGSKVFLTNRKWSWFDKQGVRVRVLREIALKAMTVNPVAPESHRFEPHDLLSAVRAALPDIPVFDVLDPAAYLPVAGSRPPPP